MVTLLLTGHWAKRMTEKIENDIDLIQPQRGLSSLEFPDETQADAGTVGQVALGHFVEFSLLSNKISNVHG